MAFECIDVGFSASGQPDEPPLEMEGSLFSSDQSAQFDEIPSFSEIEQYTTLSRDPRNSNQDHSLYHDNAAITSVGYGISLTSPTPFSTDETHAADTNEDLLKGILKV